MPTAVVISPASGIAISTGMPLEAIHAEANAPKPKNALWPSEIWPV
jgi:hypothetical protein